jgi:outer membrane protein TolC
MKLATVVMVVLILTFSLAAAEETIELTIDKALEMALEHNKNLRAAQQTVRQYKYKVKQTLDFLPTVTLDAGKNLDEKLMEIELPPLFPGAAPQKTSLDFTRTYEFTLQIVQPVFTGGKLYYTFKNARIDLDIAREQHNEARLELTLNVKKVFFNILVFQEVLKAHREALQLAQTNLDSINEKFKLGMVSKYDKLQAELTAGNIKPDILQTEKLLQLSRLNLKTITGIPLDTAIRLKGELSYTRHPLEESRFIELALVHASGLKQLNLQMKKARNLLKIAYGQFMPDISLVAAYTYRSDVFRLAAANWENFYTINLALRFPIFTGLKRTAQIGEIKVMKKILDLDTQRLNDALRIRVKELCMTLKQEYENILLGLKNMETAREGARIAGLTYDEGLITILELNTSISQVTAARVAYLRAVYNYNIAAAELEKIIGQPLPQRGES